MRSYLPGYNRLAMDGNGGRGRGRRCFGAASRLWCAALLWVAQGFAAQPVMAGPAVQDDLGRTVTLASPARRIVSLAPHATELLFAAGAGAQVIGTVEHSDHPPAAQKIPRVGRYDSLDLESIVALEPDLIVAWHSGNPRHQVDRLRDLGFAVYVSEPRSLDDIAATLERLGTLAGTARSAGEAAAAFRAELSHLRQRYGSQRPVRVFYEIWNRPLMTVNGDQIISQVIALCGGRNVFADLPTLAAQVDLEAVLAADPEAIVGGGMGETRPEWLDDWRAWPQLQAVRRGNLFFVHPDLIQRATPRILEGARLLCGQLEQARAKSAPRPDSAGG